MRFLVGDHIPNVWYRFRNKEDHNKVNLNKDKVRTKTTTIKTTTATTKQTVKTTTT